MLAGAPTVPRVGKKDSHVCWELPMQVCAGAPITVKHSRYLKVDLRSFKYTNSGQNIYSQLVKLQTLDQNKIRSFWKKKAEKTYVLGQAHHVSHVVYSFKLHHGGNVPTRITM